MKRILARLLPHLTIILGVMTLVFYVVDGFNEVMAFMASELSKQVFLALAISAILSSILLISRQWKEDDRKARKAERRREEIERIEQSEPEDPFDADDFYLSDKTKEKE